ncbi:MAG: RluA family pseudouridine synthase [Treponema sp.]|jgi:23S rRNA pseudouridine955/2504/2580 synthase|nr:RluA family pseudouridine synthase [Treponema sp.]
MTIELKAGPDDAGRRLDRILRKSLPDYSLSLIHQLLRQGKVLVNDKRAGPDERIQPGMVIRLTSTVNHNIKQVNHNHKSACPTLPPANRQALPEILWRGSGIIVFNKPPGLASHGKASLDTQVKAWLAEKLPDSLSFTPGPLHRLDRPTSGAIAFSETLEGAQLFTRLLRERKLTKTYLAIVEGQINGDEEWQDELSRDTTLKKTFAGGTQAHSALTTVKTLAVNALYSLIEAHIVTGRTHQIRAQAAFHGHPLAGDVKYGGNHRTGGFFLHAWKMELGEGLPDFPRPLVAPLPEAFQSQIQTLFGLK